VTNLLRSGNDFRFRLGTARSRKKLSSSTFCHFAESQKLNENQLAFFAPVSRCVVTKVRNTANGLKSFPIELEHFFCLLNYQLADCFVFAELPVGTLGILLSR